MVFLGEIAIIRVGQNTGLGSQNGLFGTLKYTTETCLISVNMLFKCQCDCFPDSWGGNRDSALLLVVSISRTSRFLAKNAQKWLFLSLLIPLMQKDQILKSQKNAQTSSQITYHRSRVVFSEKKLI